MDVADASWKVTNAHNATQLQGQFGAMPQKTGNFIVVDFDYTNNGNEAETLAPQLMGLYDSSNRKSSPGPDDIGYIPRDKNIFIGQVNPGVTKSGEAVFSVAPGGSGYQLELSNRNYFKTGKAYVNLGL